MNSQRVKVFEGGKLVIPAAFRRAMGIGSGDTVVVELEGSELRVRSLPEAVRQAQELVRRFNPEGRSMVAELLAERKAEADRD